MQIWKRVEVGGMGSADLLGLMDKTGVSSGPWVRSILEDQSFSISWTRVASFACCEVGELGFQKKPTMSELWTKIQELGDLCKIDHVPRLRVAFTEQLDSDFRFIAMDPVVGLPSGPSIFYLSSRRVGNNGRCKLLLESCSICSDAKWSLKNKVVFELKK